jgi:hypothetical protein
MRKYKPTLRSRSIIAPFFFLQLANYYNIGSTFSFVFSKFPIYRGSFYITSKLHEINLYEKV